MADASVGIASFDAGLADFPDLQSTGSLHEQADPQDRLTIAPDLSDDDGDALLADDLDLTLSPASTKTKQPLWRILCISTWTIGLSLSWNAMFLTSTPFFNGTLGMDPVSVSLANLAGPLSGLIFQPICGVISDESTSPWGRRRPFILGGTVLAILGMLLFAYPLQLTSLLDASRGFTIAISLIGLWAMNIGLNIVQGPAWALIYDQLPAEQQALGNSVVAIFSAAAGIMGSVMGALPLTTAFPFLSSQSLALFWFAIIILILSVIPPLFFAAEIPWQPPSPAPPAINDEGPGYQPVKPDDPDDLTDWSAGGAAAEATTAAAASGCRARFTSLGRLIRHVFYRIFVTGLYEMTEEVFWILFIYFLLNAAGSPPMFYGTDYFGEVVYHGDPNADSWLYNTGVRMGALAFAISGLVQITTSALIPIITRKLGFKPVWVAAQIITTAVLLMIIFPFCQTVEVSMAFVPILGIGTATSGVIPFALVGMMDATEEKAGLMIALLNSAQVIAQAVAILTSGLMVSLTNNVASGMSVGGGYGLISVVITILYLRVPDSKTVVVAED